MANPEGYRKALRLMRLAEKFNKPVISLIDTPGAFPGLEAEQRGQGEAIARNIIEMTRLKTPIICVIIGEGASGGALGIGVFNLVISIIFLAIASPCPLCSASNPGNAPGVSIREITGLLNFSANLISLKAFLYPSGLAIPTFLT
jgi:acetyl-CoA carboxylase alpha subunit